MLTLYDWGQRLILLPMRVVARIKPSWHLRERLFWDDLPQPKGRRIWFHAASVGEVKALATVIHAMLERSPGLEFVITTSTLTGQRTAREAIPGALAYLLAPADIRPTVRGFLRATRVTHIVQAETEIWPIRMDECRRQGIPVALVNGRISERSFGRYRGFGFLFRAAWATPSLALMRSREDLERGLALGMDPKTTSLSGNIKFDIPGRPLTLEEVPAARFRLGLPLDVVWTCGSTRPGEEALLLDAWQRLRARFLHLSLVLVPRHLERLPEVLGLIADRNLRPRLRSRGESLDQRDDVLVVDTLGELTEYYAASDIAFVGGSLVPLGGHNPLEPAALGIPALWGKYMESSASGAGVLEAAGGAFRCEDIDEMIARVTAFLTDETMRQMVGQTALRVLREHGGVARRSAEALLRAGFRDGQQA